LKADLDIRSISRHLNTCFSKEACPVAFRISVWVCERERLYTLRYVEYATAAVEPAVLKANSRIIVGVPILKT